MHHVWSRPYNDIDKEHKGRAFRLDTIRLYLSLSNFETLILQPRARLVWRACLIIVSDLMEARGSAKAGARPSGTHGRDDKASDSRP